MSSQGPVYGFVQQGQSSGTGGYNYWSGNGGYNTRHGTGSVGVVRGDGDVKPGYPAGPPPAAQQNGQAGAGSYSSSNPSSGSH